MNITKLYLGSMLVGIIRFLLIFSIISCLFACTKQAVEPSIYIVQVKNDYFEAIDSLQLGSHYLGKVKEGKASNQTPVEKGIYSFACITQSELKITAEVTIQGLTNYIIIVLNEKGKVELR